MASDKATTRSLIERKKAQIKNFEGDKQLPDKERSFTPAEYDQKISDLNKDIEELEASLTAAAE